MATALVRGLNRIHIPMTRGLGLADLLRQTFAQMQKDHLGAYAGSLTYRFLFSIFPFMAFLFSLLGLFNARGLVEEMLNRLGSVLPGPALQLIRDQVVPVVTAKNTTGFGYAALFSILVALYGVSGAFRSIMEALNVMYNVEDARPFWKKYLISIGLAFSVILLLLSALVLVGFGTTISEYIAERTALGGVFRWTWNILQWPVLVLFVLLAFALIYYFAPDVEQRFKFITPGSLIGVAMWLVYSALFSLYVRQSDLGATYGALAGVAIFMLYLYYASFILLLGAEMNQVVEDASPEGKDTGEKELPSDAEVAERKGEAPRRRRHGTTGGGHSGTKRSLPQVATAVAFILTFLSAGFLRNRQR